MEKLQHLMDEGIIDEVFQQLKTGKEAEVWLVSHRGEPVAAKLYKEREFRSFKNDAGYLEGRQVRNTRTQRAMDKGTAFGKRASEEAWKSAEANAMYALHAAGVRVPKPVLFYEGVLLMEVIGDHEGRVAPRLVEAGLTREQALPLYLRLRGEVIKMLAADLIHGDLSEFNILLGVDGPVIIDFPQVVEAARNSRSEQFFRRDLGNLVRFFSALDPDVAKHAGDVDEIWRAYTRRELTADYVPTGRSFPKQQHAQGQRQGRHDGPPPWKREQEQRRRDQQGPRGAEQPRGGPPQQGDQRRGGPPPWKQGQQQARGPGGGGPPKQGGQGRGPRGPEVSFKGAAQPTGGPPRTGGRDGHPNGAPRGGGPQGGHPGRDGAGHPAGGPRGGPQGAREGGPRGGGPQGSRDGAHPGGAPRGGGPQGVREGGHPGGRDARRRRPRRW